jgi:hypothetical protein
MRSHRALDDAEKQSVGEDVEEQRTSDEELKLLMCLDSEIKKAMKRLRW